MKKIFTFPISMMAVAAFAASPVTSQFVATSTTDVKNELVPLSVERMDAARQMEVSGRIDEVKGQAVEGVTSDDVVLQYTYPNAVFFNYVTFMMGGESYSYTPNYALVPAYKEVTFPNRSYYVAGGRWQAATDMDYAWTVGQADPVTTSYDYSMEIKPAYYRDYGIHAPMLALGDKTYQLGHEAKTQAGTTKFFADFFISGGGAYVSEADIEEYKAANAGSSDYKAVLNMFNSSVPGATGFRSEGVYNFGRTNSVKVNGAWSQMCPEGTTDHKLTGLGMLIPDPGQAWSVSNINLLFSAYIKTGAELKVSFYATTADNKPDFDKLINEYTYIADKNIGRISNPDVLELNIPFTTEDEFGDELGYKMVDGGMFMVMEADNSDSNIGVLCPLIRAYPVVNSREVRNNFMFDYICGFVSCNAGDGTPANYICDNGWVFGEDPVTYPICFNFTMDAEYPFMRPSSVFKSDATEWAEAVATDGDYVVNVKNAGDQELYEVLSSASVEDLRISLVDGGDIPEWLTIGVEDANNFFKNLEGEARSYVIQFALTDGATAGGCEVAVEYKGIKNVYRVNPELSGIEGVVDNGVETVASEYYDLQGRKLYNEPANGLFIRKDIKADGSVKSVKVVK